MLLCLALLLFHVWLFYYVATLLHKRPYTLTLWILIHIIWVTIYFRYNYVVIYNEILRGFILSTKVSDSNIKWTTTSIIYRYTTGVDKIASRQGPVDNNQSRQYIVTIDKVYNDKLTENTWSNYYLWKFKKFKTETDAIGWLCSEFNMLLGTFSSNFTELVGKIAEKFTNKYGIPTLRWEIEMETITYKNDIVKSNWNR